MVVNLYNETIDRWIQEDMPYGDITSDYLFGEGDNVEGQLVAREYGVVAGLIFAGRIFQAVSADTCFTFRAQEGEKVGPGTVLADISGKAGDVLKAERLALNLLQRLCGIATLTSRYVEALEGSGVRIADTRKTTPGLRALEKYAVRMGGGINHRFSLSDGVMLKDNHIRAAGGIQKAVELLRARVSHTVRIEVEVDSLKEYREALEAKPDIIMLDNMDADTMARAVSENPGSIILEASGKVTLERLPSIAASGVDVISSGALTHSARAMDIGLDLL